MLSRGAIFCLSLAGILLSAACVGAAGTAPAADETIRADVLVVGVTPSGISAAIAAARCGSKVVLTEMKDHMGGMMSNGLGRTDIGPRNTVGGIFREFIDNVYAYYVETYGPDSQQVKDCSGGYHFEPSVAECIFNRMVKAEKNIRVKYHYRPDGVLMYGNRIHGVDFTDTRHKKRVQIRAGVFIDATYEGDIAALAGVPYRVGRESREEYGEAYAGAIYLDHLTRMVLPGTSGDGDRRVQAYNFRLCLTRNPDNRVMPEKPDSYNREEYMQVLDSINAGRIKTVQDVLNIEPIPNGKSDTNNMPKSLISTDLPEENYDYPEASCEQREKIVKRHRDYILGLLYFLQNDPEMPEELRNECREWGFAKDEYQDNDHFPRQIYVREARRMWGLYTFSTHDALLAPGSLRTPIHFDSIACGGYPIDSHATRKREPSHDTAMEGFFWLGGLTRPYQIPYRVMVPQRVDALLVTGAVSATHLGFGTLRMEPVWMALGQAAGTAAHLARRLYVEPRDVPVNRLQSWLVAGNQILTAFDDIQGPTAEVSNEQWQAMQFYGTRGFFESYEAKPLEPLTRGKAAQWLMSCIKLGDFMPAYGPFVKHLGGGTPESCLAQLEKLQIAQAGDPNAMLTECEMASWLSRIEPWIDGSISDTWATYTRPKEELAPIPQDAGPLVTRARFCEALFAHFRSRRSAPIP
ncbi:MAG TPA: FAD-dependent oxidoreductase [Armatimonadota bacterium]|nr:FAD-dependent oxidoreductase [Armatimonadota bacterium]